ncbi:hypothetical protein H4R33_006616 [Dimargaris cristalligena]|nr:hypothetical protein H4R33_006616 [Dimargaris cristalligena]
MKISFTTVILFSLAVVCGAASLPDPLTEQEDISDSDISSVDFDAFDDSWDTNYSLSKKRVYIDSPFDMRPMIPIEWLDNQNPNEENVIPAENPEAQVNGGEIENDSREIPVVNN